METLLQLITMYSRVQKNIKYWIKKGILAIGSVKITILSLKRYLGEETMKIFTNLEQYERPNKPIVTVLGNFDGVHLGHQNLIKIAREKAAIINGETLVFTFFPHPQRLFNAKIKMLNSLKSKLRLIESLGVENVLIIPFTKDFAIITPQEFVHQILAKRLQTSHVVAGFNYSFGYKGLGDAICWLSLPKNKI